MAYDKRKRDQARKDTWAAIKALQQAVQTSMEVDPDLGEVQITLANKKEVGTPTGRWYKVEELEGGLYVITAESQEHAEEHANETGCPCQSTGEAEVTCDCS